MPTQCVSCMAARSVTSCSLPRIVPYFLQFTASSPGASIQSDVQFQKSRYFFPLVFLGKLDNDSFIEPTKRGDLHRIHQQRGCMHSSARHAANTSIISTAGEGCLVNSWRSCGAPHCWPSDPNLRAVTESRKLSS